MTCIMSATQRLSSRKPFRTPMRTRFQKYRQGKLLSATIQKTGQHELFIKPSRRLKTHYRKTGKNSRERERERENQHHDKGKGKPQTCRQGCQKRQGRRPFGKDRRWWKAIWLAKNALTFSLSDSVPYSTLLLCCRRRFLSWLSLTGDGSG